MNINAYSDSSWLFHLIFNNLQEIINSFYIIQKFPVNYASVVFLLSENKE